MKSSELLAQLVFETTQVNPDSIAIYSASQLYSYAELGDAIGKFALGMVSNGIKKYDRVAIYLEQRFETVVASFGAAHAGAMFVPVNPLLRPYQVKHIVNDCEAVVLVTSASRLQTLRDDLDAMKSLRLIVVVDVDDSAVNDMRSLGACPLSSWTTLLELDAAASSMPHLIDNDAAAIFYTSGSTGLPKGVVFSHRNFVAAARSVSSYLKLGPSDRLLCVLPFSFDAGFSQLTTAFSRGGAVVLTSILFAADIPKLVTQTGVTGIFGVPPLWRKLAAATWLDTQIETLRFIASTGGHMDLATLEKLKKLFPNRKIFLSYGFTEAFRSTYLDPSEVDKRPSSVGKAIPNAEVFVVRDNGELCEPGEVGELVQRGALVAQGYWGNKEATQKTFRPLLNPVSKICVDETVAWSGDLLRMDADGFLYFVARRDEMIKSSGIRISPEEVEEVLTQTGLVDEACVIGVPHTDLGQAVVAIVVPRQENSFKSEDLMKVCQARLPAYMVPKLIIVRENLQRNANGKIDRKAYSTEFRTEFDSATD